MPGCNSDDSRVSPSPQGGRPDTRGTKPSSGQVAPLQWLLSTDVGTAKQPVLPCRLADSHLVCTVMAVPTV